MPEQLTLLVVALAIKTGKTYHRNMQQKGCGYLPCAGISLEAWDSSVALGTVQIDAQE
jgi:hypothetical protein